MTTGEATEVKRMVGAYVPLFSGGTLGTLFPVKVQRTMVLSGETLYHVNNTIKELETVIELLDKQAQSYAATAEQLIILAEQTLAAADHSFQIADTLDATADAYGDMVADNNYITYWRAVDVDASGRISAEVYGNGIVTDYAYDQATGHLQNINSSLLSLESLRHLEYQYDEYSNVTERHDLINDIQETYDYDRLDRLTRTGVSSTLYEGESFNGSQTQSYDALGNITYKSDVGDYTYGSGAGPHAVTQAGSNTYRYDANGNMSSGDGRTLQWSSFNKPTQITRNGKSVSFSYGADRSRYKKVNHKGDETLYVGKLYEQVKRGSQLDKKYYIYAAGGVVAEHIVSTEHGTQTRYIHKDALGSIDTITDAYASVVDRRSYDAWGKLRQLPWQGQAALDDPLHITQLAFTNKGYTGHEQIAEVDLIHMNGRVYDATLARFISADPHIQDSSLSQNYNRYSYVLNNPLKYTDPSGYFFNKLFKNIGKTLRSIGPSIVSMAIMAFCQACGILAKMVINAVTGAVNAAVNGGSIFRGAVMGLTSGAIGEVMYSSIGAAIPAGAYGAKIAAHAIAGGTMSVIQGGKFMHGFVSAGFSKFASIGLTASGIYSSAKGAINVMSRTVMQSIIGGTASVLVGGKFANGAITAGMAHLFNAELSGKRAEATDSKLLEVMSEGGNAQSVTTALLFLPRSVIKLLIEHDVKIVAVTSSDKRLTKHGNLLGQYRVKDKVILIATDYRSKPITVESLSYIVLHEVGHFMDLTLLEGAHARNPYHDAYQRDHAAGGYHGGMLAGTARHEGYAEDYANYMKGNTGYFKNKPNTGAYWYPSP